MTLALGCIADDYTGASDLANTLTRCGLRTVQTIGVPAEDFTGLAVWRASMPRPAEIDCMQVFYAPRSIASTSTADFIYASFSPRRRGGLSPGLGGGR